MSSLSEAEKALHYPFEALPQPGETLPVAPGIHWVRMALPYALDHINLWLLEDGEDWVIVDSGLGNTATRELWDTVITAKLAGRRVSRIILTHYHPDHAGNAAWLAERFGAPVLMSQADFLTAHAHRDETAGFRREDSVAMFRANGMDAALCEKLSVGGNAYRRGVPEFPSSYQRLMEGDEVVIGGHAWRVLMGYGHAPEHAALHCASLGVMISGDMVLPRISTNVSVPASQPRANSLKLFLDSIARYATLPGNTLVLPSHGRPFRGLRERATQLADHHRLRLSELRDVCGEPRTAADVLTTLFRRPLDAHQMFFAMGEAMAHLHYLCEEGELRRVASEGIVRYVRTE